MRDTVARGFFVLAYEHIGRLALLSFLRAAPWLALALTLSFLPLDPDSARRTLTITAGLTLLAIGLAPWTGGAAHLAAARLARGEAAAFRACFVDAGRSYPQLLGWTLAQGALGLLALHNLYSYFALAPDARGFMMLLALGAGFWLWILARFWNFVALPLHLARRRGARETTRLGLLLILSAPGPLIRHFLFRQALALLMLITGLGLLLGLGGLLPLQAALTLRESLRPQGLDLVPAGESERNLPLELPEDLRRFWRPW